MDYNRIYDKIISSAKSRGINKKSIGFKVEIHHIIPRCMGGADSRDNLVALTQREHYLIHILLTKIHPASDKLKVACYFMTRQGKTSRMYESFREAQSIIVREYRTGKIMSDETKAKIYIESRNDKISESLKTYLKDNPREPRSSESRILTGVAISEAMANMSIEDRKLKYGRLGETNGRFGKPYVWSEEAKAKSSLKLKGVPKPKVECPHCKKMIAVNTSRRYHFDNCKLITGLLKFDMSDDTKRGISEGKIRSNLEKR